MESTDKSGKKLWCPSWKGVIITLLVGSNIILIRIIEALVYKGQSLENEISQWKQLWVNTTQSSAETKKQLCVNINKKTSECTVCPSGWLWHRENCYYISSGGDRRTWKESREGCEEMGADLLVIEDREQQEFIHSASREQVYGKFWIGLYRGEDGDGWRWVDGRLYNTGLLQILKKYSGNCVWLESEYFYRYPRWEADSGYNKDDCQSKHSWICQKTAPKI